MDNNQDSAPRLCLNGCGFFGNPANENMCSLCYKRTQDARNLDAQAVDTVKKELEGAVTAAIEEHKASAPAPAEPVTESMEVDTPAPAPVEPAPAPAPVPETPAAPEVVPAETPVAPPAVEDEGSSAPAVPEKKVQKNTSRCWSCKAKIGLLGFKCRCGYTFCGTHRYSDRHECDFDYKTAGKEMIEQANPIVTGAKITRI